MSRWTPEQAVHLVDVDKDEVTSQSEASITVKACSKFEPHSRHLYMDGLRPTFERLGVTAHAYYDCGGIDEALGCRGSCYYGTCGFGHSSMACGGCCGCMGGCELLVGLAESRKTEAGA